MSSSIGFPKYDTFNPETAQRSTIVTAPTAGLLERTKKMQPLPMTTAKSDLSFYKKYEPVSHLQHEREEDPSQSNTPKFNFSREFFFDGNNVTDDRDEALEKLGFKKMYTDDSDRWTQSNRMNRASDHTVEIWARRNPVTGGREVRKFFVHSQLAITPISADRSVVYAHSVGLPFVADRVLK